MEDFKQKIQKQKKLKNKTIKELQKFLPNEEINFIEPIIEEAESKVIKAKKLTPRQEQMNKPVFTNKNEKFEWLMNFGCTSSDDRTWLRKYKESEEYKLTYET